MSEPMPAITLWQPWATWVSLGLKTIETRGHRMLAPLVGRRVAIHAGRTWDDGAARVAGPYLTDGDRRALAARGGVRYTGPYRLGDIAPAAFPAGAIVATARAAACRELTDADSAAALCPCGPGRWGLLLADVLAVEPPVACRGNRGVWYLTAEQAAALARSSP